MKTHKNKTKNKKLKKRNWGKTAIKQQQNKHTKKQIKQNENKMKKNEKNRKIKQMGGKKTTNKHGNIGMGQNQKNLLFF